MLRKEREHEHLSPAEARAGRQINFAGVAIEVLEVNEAKPPKGLLGIPSTFTVCYRVRDNRQSPPFVSDKAHLFVNEGTNLIDEFRKVITHYEQIKSQLRS
jgi:hypothetical protein